jgi:hypothetical protein
VESEVLCSDSTALALHTSIRKAAGFFEMSVYNCQTTRRHIALNFAICHPGELESLLPSNCCIKFRVI